MGIHATIQLICLGLNAFCVGVHLADPPTYPLWLRILSLTGVVYCGFFFVYNLSHGL